MARTGACPMRCAGDDRDARAAAAARRTVKRRGHPPRIARIAHAHRREAAPRIVHAARQHAMHRDDLRRERPIAARRRVVRRNAAGRRLEADYTAGISGIAHRASAVAAMRQRTDAGRHRHRAATGRAARRHATIPRTIGRAVQRIIREPAHRQLRHVGAADDDRTGAAQIGDHRAVVRRNHIPERGNAVRGGAPTLVDIAFHRHRYAVQRRQGFTGSDAPIGGIGLAQRLVGQHDRHRIERRIDGREPVECSLHHLAHRDVAPRHRGGGFVRAPTPILVHAVVPSEPLRAIARSALRSVLLTPVFGSAVTKLTDTGTL